MRERHGCAAIVLSAFAMVLCLLFGLGSASVVRAEPVAASQADVKAAVAVLKKIYTSKNVSWSREVFTPEVQALFTQVDVVDEMGLGFDPFIDAQDFELTDVTYTPQVTASGITVTVKFMNIGQATEIRFEMVRTGKKWLIADMTSHDAEGEKWRLTGMLTHIIALGNERVAAEAFVRGIYEPDPADMTEIPERFTPEVEALYDRAEAADDMGLGFDPFVDGQDAELKDFDYSSWLTDQGAIVQVRFYNFGQRKFLSYELVKTEAGWRIADMASLDGDTEIWRLTVLLNAIIADAAKPPTVVSGS